MLVCAQCGNEQESGKFCGKCGSPELEQATEIVSEFTEPDETFKSEQKIDLPNKDLTEKEISQLTQAEIDEKIQAGIDARIAIELAESKERERHNTESEKIKDVKDKTRKYGHYFLDILSNPTKVFTMTENKFNYSLINIVLFAFLFSLYMYRSLIMAVGGFGSVYTPLFTQTVGPILFAMLIALAAAIVTTFLMAQLTFKRPHLKYVITQYGSLLIPVIALQIIALILTFVGLPIVAGILILILMSITFMYIPLQLVNEYEVARREVGQRIYINIFTVILVSIIVTVVMFVLATNLGQAIVDVLDELLYW